VHPEHAEPVPIEIHYVRPRTRGGGESQRVTLCANAHGRVHALLEEIEAFAMTSPFRTTGEVLRHLPVWSEYDVTERAIAYHGWMAYGLGFLNKRYATAHAYWRTDGTPKGPDIPQFDDLGHAARWSKKWRRELGAL
jgi:hypothetical protein